MKNIFDINSDRGVLDGEIFCTKEVSLETAMVSDEAVAELEKIEGKAEQSWISMGIEGLCIFFLAACIKAVTNTEVTMKEAFQNAPYLFILAAVALIYLIVLFFRKRIKKRRVEKQIEESDLVENMEELYQKIRDELEIPEDSLSVDVLADVYEIKRNKRKSAISPVVVNSMVDMYVKGDKLCFANAEQEISIAIHEITKIEKVKKRLSIMEWNKEEPYKDKQYKKFKLEENDYGILVKWYYSVQIDSLWGQYEIRFPNYEEDAVRKIEEITGKRVLD